MAGDKVSAEAKITARLKELMGTDSDGNLAKDMYTVFQDKLKEKQEDFRAKIAALKERLVDLGFAAPTRSTVEVARLACLLACIVLQSLPCCQLFCPMLPQCGVWYTVHVGRVYCRRLAKATTVRTAASVIVHPSLLPSSLSLYSCCFCKGALNS